MNPFTGLTAKIFGGVAAVGLLAAGIQTWRLGNAQEARDEALLALGAEQSAHDVTRASVATLKDAIEGMNAEADKRAAEFAESKRQVEREAAQLRSRARSSDAQIARLREMANRPATQGCEAPADLLRELENLQ